MIVGQGFFAEQQAAVSGRDESKYLLLAYRMNSPSQVDLPAEPQYPPGWPLLIAAALRSGAELRHLYLLSATSIAVACGLLSVIWLPRSGALAAAAAAIAFAGHPVTRWLADSLLSEPSFFLVLACTLLAADSLDRTTPRTTAILGLLCCLCRLFRTAGFAVWAALIIVYALDRRLPFRTRLLHLAILTLPLLATEAGLRRWNPPAALSLETGYGAQLQERTAAEKWSVATMRTGRQAIQRVKTLAASSIPISRSHWPSRPVIAAIAVLTVAAGAFGMACELLRGQPIATVTAVQIAMVFAWPYSENRFAWPAVPFIWLFACQVLTAATLSLRPRAAAMFPALTCLAAITAACTALADGPP